VGTGKVPPISAEAVTCQRRTKGASICRSGWVGRDVPVAQVLLLERLPISSSTLRSNGWRSRRLWHG